MNDFAWLILSWVMYMVGLGMGYWWGLSEAPVEDPFNWAYTEDDND